MSSADIVINIEYYIHLKLRKVKMELLDSNKYPDYYTKVWASFLKVYDYELEDSWLESNVADLVSCFAIKQDVPLRILSIGSGSGKNVKLSLWMGRGFCY